MSRKRINLQDSSVDARPHKARRKAKNRDAKKSAAKNLVPKSFPARARVIAAFALVMLLIATTAILTQRGKLKTPPVQNHTEQDKNTLMRAKGEPNPPQPSQQRFNDVPISGPNANIFAAFIERMGFLDIWPGCGNGNYCPTAPVTRRQMAHILVKAFGI